MTRWERPPHGGLRRGRGPSGGPGRRPHGWNPWEHGRPQFSERHQRGNRLFGPVVPVLLIQLIGCAVGGGHLPPLAVALLVLGPLLLPARDRHPVPVFAANMAFTVAYFVLRFPDGPAFLATLLALVATVRAGRHWAARIILGLGYGAYLMLVSVPWPRAVGVAAWALVAYVFAAAARVRTAQIAAIARARAEQERAAEEQQRRQASDERLRIARELHDVLGHHLSLINVQAGVGLHLIDERPEQAKAALTAIKQASSEALREVRSVLAALRPEAEAAPRAPAPGLADVPDLVAGAGLPVAYTVAGTPEDVPPEVDRAAYRIVQEALTNVRRHAGPDATATLVVDYRPDRLEVRVSDDGTGGGTVETSAGNGIAGMRERATALGGTLHAGPRKASGDGGGFEVVASLPRNGSTHDPRRTC